MVISDALWRSPSSKMLYLVQLGEKLMIDRVAAAHSSSSQRAEGPDQQGARKPQEIRRALVSPQEIS
jgi:hypothetical protein